MTCKDKEAIAVQTQKWGFLSISKSGIVFNGQYLGSYCIDFAEIWIWPPYESKLSSDGVLRQSRKACRSFGCQSQNFCQNIAFLGTLKIFLKVAYPSVVQHQKLPLFPKFHDFLTKPHGCPSPSFTPLHYIKSLLIWFNFSIQFLPWNRMNLILICSHWFPSWIG